MRAIGEYQRMIFFSSDRDSVDYYRFRIAECYRKNNEFEKASKIYDNLILKGVRDPVIEEKSIIGTAICSINGGAVEHARTTLNGLRNIIEVCDTVDYLIGVTYLKQGRFDEAEEEFRRITSPTLKQNAFCMYRRLSNQHFKSPRIALLLSTFIPGAGQIYASRPFNGIISFSLNLSLGYLTYKAVEKDRKMDAILIVYFGLQRFYFGNLHQAKSYAIEHNRRIVENVIIE